MFACAAVSAHAQAQSFLTAADLERECAAWSDEEARVRCAFVIRSFSDGYIEGVGAGVFGVYKHDPEVAALVGPKKAADMLPRVSDVVRRSTCIQEASTEELAAAFVRYVRDNPMVRPAPYRKALFRTIEQKFCR